MVTVQGCLAVAQELKRLRPDIPIVLGGISATYYASEVIRLPYVDMVMRGYDTLEPMDRLLGALLAGKDPSGIPNLLWKTRDGQVRDGGFTYQPSSMGCGIDWSDSVEDGTTSLLPIRELLSNQNTGCAHSCGWCGGSREAFERICGQDHALIQKPAEEVAFEFQSMKGMKDVEKFHVYSIGTYNETNGRLRALLDQVRDAGVKSVNYEQFQLPPEDLVRRMVAANSHTTITLSPESHDREVARRAGRGVYGNEEMEAWIERALDLGIGRVDLWYFVGMPGQDAASVAGTVEYCERLLEKYGGRAVTPMICPMMPFLDPASTFFEEPETHGYRLFARSAEEHRRLMTRASPVHRMNYETRWLDRSSIFTLGLQAIRDVMRAKASHGIFSAPRVEQFAARIDDAVEFTRVVTEAEAIADPKDRARALDGLGDEIARRNETLLTGGVMDQIYPLRRQIGGRWVDELGWDEKALRAWSAKRLDPVAAP
jgi:clorobiocin biosynthesis protein CloN6